MSKILRDEYLDSQEGFQAGTLCVMKEGVIIHEEEKGFIDSTSGKIKVRRDFIFDLASLTKVLSTSLILGKLFDKNTISPYACVGDYFTSGRKEVLKITIAQLLTHTSGFPSYLPFYRCVPLNMWGTDYAREIYLKNILNLRLEEGKKRIYSDIGYMLLGFIIEKACGKELKEVFKEEVLNTLEQRGIFLKNTFAGGTERENVVPTEFSFYDNKILKGIVHDENARALGGFAGHAGLFSNAFESTLLAHQYIDSYFGNGIISKKTAEEMLSLGSPSVFLPPMGWDFPEGENSIYGDVPENTFAHTGFTGCLVLINIRFKIAFSFLTNRIYPLRTHHRIENLRKRVIGEIFRRFVFEDKG